MSSVVRTIQTPYFSFQRSSTPMPYSFGKPALNCCGGSLRTLGNMNRPVAASAAADAAENAPQARPIQARRLRSGDVSSASRVLAFAAAGAVVAALAAAAPPVDAMLVVLPARSGIGAAGGRGAAAGRAAGVVVACGVAAGFAPVAGALAVAPAAGARGEAAAAAVASPVCGTIFGAGVSGFVSSGIYSHQLTKSPIHELSHHLQGFQRRLTHPHAAILLAEARHRRQKRLVPERRRRAEAADHDVGNRIAVIVLAHVARDGPFDVR